MGMAQISRRLKRPSEAIKPSSVRSFTFEGLCREYWRQDAPGFQAFVERECPVVGMFLESLRREEAEAAGDRRMR